MTNPVIIFLLGAAAGALLAALAWRLARRGAPGVRAAVPQTTAGPPAGLQPLQAHLSPVEDDPVSAPGLLRQAIETMLDGLLVIDLQGRIRYINPAGARLLSKSGADLAGRPVWELLETETARETSKAYLATLVQNEVTTETSAAEIEDVAQGGRPFYAFVRAALMPQSAQSPTHVVVNITDISQSRWYERQLLTLNRTISELLQIQDQQQLIQKLLPACRALFAADASGIYLPAAGQTGDSRLILACARNGEADNGLEQGDAERLEAVLAQLHQTLSIADTSKDGAEAERTRFLAAYGIQALMALPLVSAGQSLGALLVCHRQPHPFSEQENQLGAILAYAVTTALQNVHLYQSEHSQRQLAEALSQAATAVNSTLDLDRVLDLILEQTRRVADCQSVNIMLIEGSLVYIARRLGYAAFPQHDQAISQFGYPLTTPTLQKMSATGQPILISDVGQDQHWVSFEGSEWIGSYAGAPLQVGGETIGFLNVDSDKPGFFGAETVPRLQVFAAHAATAIHNARLYHQLQQHTLELEARVEARTAELRSAKERIEVILASVPDAVFVLDEGFQLAQANQAGEKLLARAANQGLELFNTDFLKQLAGHTTPSEKAVIEVQQRAYQAVASRLSVDATATGMVIVFRDVTRFRELDRMKSQFVSDVSHELRTPLTNMTLYLDLLAAARDDDKRQAYLETMSRETLRLRHLIEDLLTISRLEAGRLQVSLKKVDVNRLIADLALDRMMLASNKGLELVYETSPDLPPVLADPVLLNQCFSNLLTNAINYTPAGGKVFLRTVPETVGGSAWVTVQVIDTGYGIRSDEIDHIFERFYRGSASHNTGAPGTGLGLAISKEIVERMGARITVHSQSSYGSCFTVWLKSVS